MGSRWQWLGATVLALSIQNPALAGVSNTEASRLGADLTPYGAERAGNASGTIPAWTGGYDSWPEGYEGSGQHHINPFPDDRVLFSIDHTNLDLYRSRIGDGIAKMMKTYPDSFRIDVYETRRTHTTPKDVVQNIRANATRAKLDEAGNGFTNAYGGIPFPILHGSNENMAHQVIWNHLTRWRGRYSEQESSEVAVQPNGAYMPVTYRHELFFSLYDLEENVDTFDGIMNYYFSQVTFPAAYAGGGILVHQTVNQITNPRKAWGFSAGQNTVKKAPNMGYDTPIAASGDLRTIDDTDMFNGAVDRYDWRYEGVKEIYIPYNNYLVEGGTSYDEVLDKHHINPNLVRWELHRVHVVEATLKKGSRHIYKKRRFYVDEDSWSIALLDQYNNNDQLWRVSVSTLKNYYELPGVWTSQDVYYDMLQNKYHVRGLDSEQDSTRMFTDDHPGKRHFSPFTLRRRLSN